MKNIIQWLKKDSVLTISLVLAIVSMFIIPMDSQYIDYINYDTLIILFCLMICVKGLSYSNLFDRIGQLLLQIVHSSTQVAYVLVFLTFILAMFVTNDVALLTFVPFSFMILKLINLEEDVVSLVVLMTISANLGSMALPMGNPQNIYLYALSGYSFIEFVALLLPYVLISALLLYISVRVLIKKRSLQVEFSRTYPLIRNDVVVYGILFIISILSVCKLINPWVVLIIVLIVVMFHKRVLFKTVDYSLLITFTAFFIFVGNLNRFPGFKEMIESIVMNHELWISVGLSQIISNVPCALLLSHYTDNIKSLIIGTNLGGLGTLIASMASLISYKLICNAYPQVKVKYFYQFTVINIIFLIVLVFSTIIFH